MPHIQTKPGNSCDILELVKQIKELKEFAIPLVERIHAAVQASNNKLSQSQQADILKGLALMGKGYSKVEQNLRLLAKVNSAENNGISKLSELKTFQNKGLSDSQINDKKRKLLEAQSILLLYFVCFLLHQRELCSLENNIKLSHFIDSAHHQLLQIEPPFLDEIPDNDLDPSELLEVSPASLVSILGQKQPDSGIQEYFRVIIFLFLLHRVGKFFDAPKSFKDSLSADSFGKGHASDFLSDDVSSSAVIEDLERSEAESDCDEPRVLETNDAAEEDQNLRYPGLCDFKVVPSGCSSIAPQDDLVSVNDPEEPTLARNLSLSGLPEQGPPTICNFASSISSSTTSGYTSSTNSEIFNEEDNIKAAPLKQKTEEERFLEYADAKLNPLYEKHGAKAMLKRNKRLADVESIRKAIWEANPLLKEAKKAIEHFVKNIEQLLKNEDLKGLYKYLDLASMTQDNSRVFKKLNKVKEEILLNQSKGNPNQRSVFNVRFKKHGLYRGLMKMSPCHSTQAFLYLVRKARSILNDEKACAAIAKGNESFSEEIRKAHIRLIGKTLGSHHKPHHRAKTETAKGKAHSFSNIEKTPTQSSADKKSKTRCPNRGDNSKRHSRHHSSSHYEKSAIENVHRSAQGASKKNKKDSGISMQESSAFQKRDQHDSEAKRPSSLHDFFKHKRGKSAELSSSLQHQRKTGKDADHSYGMRERANRAR